jgi:hypothetical protein
LEVHQVEWDYDTPFYPALDGQLVDIHERLRFSHCSQNGFGPTITVNYWIDQYNARLHLLGYSQYELWYNGTYHGNEGVYFAYDTDDTA